VENIQKTVAGGDSKLADLPSTSTFSCLIADSYSEPYGKFSADQSQLADSQIIVEFEHLLMTLYGANLPKD